jgi:hypothetical protein
MTRFPVVPSFAKFSLILQIMQKNGPTFGGQPDGSEGSSLSLTKAEGSLVVSNVHNISCPTNT